jgi:hypothetical protein
MISEQTPPNKNINDRKKYNYYNYNLYDNYITEFCNEVIYLNNRLVLIK